MATHSFKLELTSPISPAKLFKANVVEGNKIGPLALPNIVASAAIIQGDGGVGSIRQIKFTDAVPWGSVTERFEILDNDKLEVKLVLVEGAGLGDKIEWGTYLIKVEPAAEGGSLYTILNEFKTISGFEYNAEEIEGIKKGMIGMFKAVEAYLLANPDCV